MLKLDFNERADSIPQWLKDFSVDTTQLWKYPDRKTVESMIADKFGATAEQVFLSNGGDESIELLFKLCKLNQESIVLPTPAFSQYTHNLSVWGLDCTLIEGLPNLAIDVEGIKKRLSQGQWLIITRPNNPTGECLDHQILLDLIKVAKEKGTKVFLDEAYIEFDLAQKEIEYALTFDHVVSLRTFSKAYGLAGARVGYLIGHEDLIAEFRKIAMPFNVNRLSLQVVKMALQNISEMQKYCQRIAENRSEIYTYLKSRNIEVFDGKGNFLLFKVKAKMKTLLASFMQKNNIQIKTQVNDLPDWVRITIPECSQSLMQVLQTVFEPQILGFDMDGVLIDTSQSYDACIKKTVLFFTEKEVTDEDINQLREQGGYNNDWDLSQGLIRRFGMEVQLQKVIERFQIFYDGDDQQMGLKEKELRLIAKDEAIELFSDDRITAIITGRPKNEANAGVDLLKITPDHIISADHVSEQKPSPEGIKWLKSTCQKQRMWFCGDTVDDMQAGVAADCVCIGIGDNHKNLYAAGADLVLKSINELTELL